MGVERVPKTVEPGLPLGMPGAMNLILPSRFGPRRFGRPFPDLAAASSLQRAYSRKMLIKHRLLNQARIDR
ncbi:hypothetical protein [Actinoallomurus iriomotensis]|uniref:Uncharacterized protein n=1 Tax=Actinoallomurus iriomotensis TaxID=478107 RepID=A0A9W6RRV9_9ACTN|nr:hypothetical protein [Actinoallomurus iriomotensis]GLY80593.1 hypothetical protein Airi01_088600 [Actinoallomurus iriomotensis]